MTIVYFDTHRRVARPRVGRDGIFQGDRVTAAAAGAATRTARATRRAWPVSASWTLKLRRRLRITSVKPKGRAVVMSGRISRPLGKPLQEVVVTRRVSCGSVKVVKRFKPRRSGRFRVTLQGAQERQVATFRFHTKVRFRVGLARLFHTFTLPQYVDIG